jgi:hypothetical protein
MRNHFLARTWLLIALLAVCGHGAAQDDASLQWRRNLYLKIKDNLSLPVTARMQKMPAFLFEQTRADDREIGVAHTERYAAHAPSAAESALLKSYLELLPPAHRAVFEKKLLGIYMVDDFAGAALTDWAADADGKVYYYLVLNSELFSRSIDDWLTLKDNSSFDDAGAGPTIRVRTGTDYKALLYGLLHEGAHVVDYELAVTPYVDDLHRKFAARTAERSAFTDDVWLGRQKPKAEYDFKHRADVYLYRIFSSKALIPRRELATMFDQLAATPFVSFYSGTSWNEHLADFLTYHHIESKLGGAVTLELVDEQKVIRRIAPTKSPAAQKKQAALQVFYQ